MLPAAPHQIYTILTSASMKASCAACAAGATVIASADNAVAAAATCTCKCETVRPQHRDRCIRPGKTAEHGMLHAS